MMIRWIFSKEVLVLWNLRFRVSIAFSCCTLVTFPVTVWRGALGTAVTFLYTESMCCWLSALLKWCSVRRQTWRSVLDDTYAVTKNEGAMPVWPTLLTSACLSHFGLHMLLMLEPYQNVRSFVLCTRLVMLLLWSETVSLPAVALLLSCPRDHVAGPWGAYCVLYCQ